MFLTASAKARKVVSLGLEDLYDLRELFLPAFCTISSIQCNEEITYCDERIASLPLEEDIPIKTYKKLPQKTTKQFD
ncbi:unnamed protein product, partial [Allacma fusca]